MESNSSVNVKTEGFDGHEFDELRLYWFEKRQVVSRTGGSRSGYCREVPQNRFERRIDSCASAQAVDAKQLFETWNLLSKSGTAETAARALLDSS